MIIMHTTTITTTSLTIMITSTSSSASSRVSYLFESLYVYTLVIYLLFAVMYTIVRFNQSLKTTVR